MRSAEEIAASSGAGAGAGARKPSHAEISLAHGAQEYDLHGAAAQGRDRQDSYVVRTEDELVSARLGDTKNMTHAEVSERFGSDDYASLRHFQIPSHRGAQEALHRLKTRSYVASSAVSKFRLLFTNAMSYVAYLSWYGVLEVLGAGKNAAPDEGAGIAAQWIYAGIVCFVSYGVFYIALGRYEMMARLSGKSINVNEQQPREFDRQVFGKCISMFSKAGMFAAAYAVNEALQLSLPVATNEVFWRWFAAGALTVLFAIIVSVLSTAEKKAEDAVPAGVTITTEFGASGLSDERVEAIVRRNTMWLLHDVWTSTFAWLIAMLFASALRVTFQTRFWENDPAPALQAAPPPAASRSCAVADAHPCTPTPLDEQIVAEWVIFGVATVVAAATLIAKRNDLTSQSDEETVDGQDNAHPCAGCLGLFCVFERREGQGRQTKAMMKGAIAGVLLGAAVGAYVGNAEYGFTGAGVGALIGAVALSAAGMGIGATCYKMETDALVNPMQKGANAVKMLAAAGLTRLERLESLAQDSIERAVMVEGVYDELANVISLAQQLMEESTVWLVAITLFDAVKLTVYERGGLMGEWGRMAIIAAAITALGAAIALAMDLVNSMMAHDMLHETDDTSGTARRNLFFYSELAEVLSSALGLVIGRAWNFAIIGALEYHGLVDDGEHAPIMVYAMFATSFAVLLSYQMACNVPDRMDRELYGAPSFDQVERMTPEQKQRDWLHASPSLRAIRSALTIDEWDRLEADAPSPRSHLTSIGAAVGLGIGALIGAYVGDAEHGFTGAVAGAVIGALACAIVVGGLFAALAEVLFKDVDDELLGSGVRSSDDLSTSVELTQKHEVGPGIRLANV